MEFVKDLWDRGMLEFQSDAAADQEIWEASAGFGLQGFEHILCSTT